MTPQQHINVAEELLRRLDDPEELHDDPFTWQKLVDRVNLHIAVARAQLEAL